MGRSVADKTFFSRAPTMMPPLTHASPLQQPPVVLTLAGSDSSGGAGLQADLKTFEALRCYGASVVTCTTAQNTHTVRDIFPISDSHFAHQLDCVLEDLPITAIKIGMLYQPSLMHITYQRLRHLRGVAIIVDPVMISKSQVSLLPPSAHEALLEWIVPLATFLTPNLPEALALTGKQQPLASLDAGRITDLARALQLPGMHILIKGGHHPAAEKEGNVKDYFLTSENHAHWLQGKWIKSSNTHGTGCTLSSAIAALTAHGYTALNAVVDAKKYVELALIQSAQWKLGRGCGPLGHAQAARAFWSPKSANPA